MSKEQRAQRRTEKQKKNSLLSNLIIVICVAVMLFSGYQIYSIYADRAAGDAINEKLEGYTQFETEQNGDKVLRPELVVDFEALQQEYRDVCGWIFFEDTVINYPVVQANAKNPDYYLTHAATGEYSVYGAIYVDAGNTPGFADQKTVIYGHRMNNGSMFAELLNYEDPAYYEAHPYGLLATPEGTYVLEVASAAKIPADLSYYQLQFETEADLLWDVSHLRQDDFLDTGVEIGAEDSFVMLSTCVKHDSSKRFIVLAKLVPIEEFDFSTVQN